MTASADGVPEGACSQVFTERYAEFIFSNDRVTAFGPDRYAFEALTAKASHLDG
jgi:hypothetical protein